MLIDTHCHLDDPTLLASLPEILAAARGAGVVKYIVPGVAPEGWDGIARLAEEWDGVCPAFGLHPMFAGLYDEILLTRLRSFAGRAVAIGEIGLDYLAEVPRERQQAAFRGQLRLAVEAGLPVMIHCRRAFQDLLAILREEHVQRVGGVMHAFSGSPEVARECIGLGLYISVAGTVTYRNAVRPLEVVREIPLEHLLLETDAPDMTPEPHRGRGNEPAFLVEIARKVAETKGVTVEEVTAATTRNAVRLFRLS
ncbi:MAG: TatD family hydrolase [Geobacteraceae bacterium]|nr:TatD family hydrolase [Geobacteraceae bacterium]